MVSPVSVARVASSVFQSRSREPLESPGVRGDQQLCCAGIDGLAHLGPPATDRFDRELSCVGVGTDVDPAGVGGDVIDPVGGDLAQCRVGEVVHIRLPRRSGGFPFPTGSGEVADQHLLLRVDADHRITGCLKLCRLGVEITELGVPVGMLGAFEGFDVRLQAVPGLLEQVGHRPRRYRMTGAGQLRRQLRGRLRRPPQRRFRIAAGDRIHQGIQGPRQQRVADLLRRPPRPGTTHPARDRLGVVQFPQPLRHGVRVRPAHRSDSLDPTPAQRLGLSTQQQPPRPLIQMRSDQTQPRPHRINIGTRQPHTTTLPKSNRQTYAISRRVLRSYTPQHRQTLTHKEKRQHRNLIVGNSG